MTDSDPITVLAADTCLPACSAAVVTGDTVLAGRFDTRRQGHSDVLLPMIEAVLIEAGLTYADIDRLAVTIGPGSFTGVRVGLAAMRGMALALDRPVLGLTTLEVIAAGGARSADVEPGSRILAAIDARRGEVYWQDFRAGSHWWAVEAEIRPAVAPPAAVYLDTPPDLVIGSGAALLRDTGITGDAPCMDAMPEAAVAAVMAAHRPLPDPYAPPKPLYLRAPDAKLPAKNAKHVPA